MSLLLHLLPLIVFEYFQHLRPNLNININIVLSHCIIVNKMKICMFMINNDLPSSNNANAAYVRANWEVVMIFDCKLTASMKLGCKRVLSLW